MIGILSFTVVLSGMFVFVCTLSKISTVASVLSCSAMFANRSLVIWVASDDFFWDLVSVSVADLPIPLSLMVHKRCVSDALKVMIS